MKSFLYKTLATKATILLAVAVSFGAAANGNHFETVEIEFKSRTIEYFVRFGLDALALIT